MKSLKFNFLPLNMVIALVLSLSITSCEQDKLVNNTTNQAQKAMVVVDTHLLLENDMRLHDLKKIVEQEVTKKGVPHFDQVTFIEYSQPGITALILPFNLADQMKTTSLIAYFVDGVYDNSFYIEFNPSEAYQQKVIDNPNQAYSGDFTVYTKNSEIAARTSIENGLTINTYTNIDNRSCMSNCLANTWNNLNWWQQIGCGGSFGSCVYGYNIYACAVVAGCAGIMVWHCYFTIC